MKILVTGATSGLGLNAVEFLQQKGIPLIATGRNLQQGKILQQNNCEFVAADLAYLTNDTAESMFHDVDTVWHCAALSSAWGNYNDFFSTNVTATENLIKYAIQANIKTFVHISTPSIYFDYQNHYSIDENYCSSKFVNHYAETKMMAELKVKAAAIKHQDISFIMLRPRAIFGEHDRVLLPNVLELLRKKKNKLILPRGGNALMDMTYVLNVVEAMFLSSTLSDEKKRLLSGNAYNITNQDPVQLKYVLTSIIKNHLGIDFSIKSAPYHVLDLAARLIECWGDITNKQPILTRYGLASLNYDMILNTEKAQRDLGYRAKYSVDEAITRTADWFKINGKNNSI